jgi:bacillithiol system protein YtxJ
VGATDFRNLTEMAELDDWFERSRERDVVLFLHDYWCPISSRAYDEMSLVEGDIALVDVAEGRELTRSIETRTGVKHESPQVLILRGAKARWAASHGSITHEAVGEAITAP